MGTEPQPLAPVRTLVDPYGDPLWDSTTGAIPTVLKGSYVQSGNGSVKTTDNFLAFGGQLLGSYQPLILAQTPTALDAVSPASFYSLWVQASLSGFNGSTWDRIRVLFNSGVIATPYSGMQAVPITTATTTALKAAAGVIGTLSNCYAPAGTPTATGLITAYDNTAASGKVVWSGTLAANQVLPLGIPCSIGITVVTAAANAIAVTYA